MDEIIYVDSPFPNPQEIEDNSEETTIEYGNHISISDLTEEIRNQYNINNLNIILITDEWGAYSIFPWVNTNYYITMVRASTIQTSFILPHEIGHFLGLHHTHAYSMDGINTLQSDPISSPANWVDPINKCFIMGDFICDTSFDCYNFCEYALGCDASYLYQDHHPDQEQSEYEECRLDYSPPLDNLMSRYGDRQFLTNEQGARARYYLMYRLNNNLNGNILHLYD